ncbi:MAG: hypothetical protein ACI4QL_01060 [Candidatus Fimimonas sp.]
MFEKLSKKIFNSIFLVVLAFVLFTGTISYLTITGYINRMQQRRSQQNAQNGVAGCQNYLDTVMAFVSNTCGKQDVVDALSGGGSEIVGRLDDLCNNSVRIDGAILYGENGFVSYSAGMGSVPQFSELKKVAEIEEFLQSQQKSVVSVRRKAISQVYNKNFYNTTNGIVSCIHKVYGENGEVLGVLEADILPQTLYSAKLQFSSFGAYSSVFLRDGDGLFCEDESFLQYQAKNVGVTKDAKYYVVSEPFDSKTDIVVFSPLNEFFKRAVVLFFVFFAIDVLLVCIAAVVAFSVRDKVVSPLERLLERMNTEGSAIR